MTDASTPAPTFIDVCCGCGGLTRGLIDAGLAHVAGYDVDPAAIETYNANFPGHGFVADIKDLELPNGAAEVVGSGLPCQGYSTLGKLESRDPRNRLWRQFLRIVHQVRPLAGVVENVPQFLKRREATLLVDWLQHHGYRVVTGTLKATRFGVAQRRERAIVLFALGVDPVIPVGEDINPTVRESLSGLSFIPDGLNDHEARRHGETALKRFAHVPPGGSRLDLPKRLQSPCWKRTTKGATNSFGRLEWDRPADTLRTVYLKPETGRFIHPSENRGLTVREGARLQGFPDDFVFKGGSERRAHHIGNAVPPPVARAIGIELTRLVHSVRSGLAAASAADPVAA